MEIILNTTKNDGKLTISNCDDEERLLQSVMVDWAMSDPAEEREYVKAARKAILLVLAKDGFEDAIVLYAFLSLTWDGKHVGNEVFDSTVRDELRPLLKDAIRNNGNVYASVVESAMEQAETVIESGKFDEYHRQATRNTLQVAFDAWKRSKCF